jgi:hypothetical protein
MWRRPVRTCNGPIPASNVQAKPGTLYRSGLGVGMSPAIKKAPPMIYRPGIRYQQPACCQIQYVNIPTIDTVSHE